MQKLLLPALSLGLFVACAPAAQRPPQSQIQATSSMQGHLLTVSLMNVGPHAMLLENSCPRPFALDVLDYPGKDTGAIKPRQYDACWDVNFPAQVWNVGESITTGVTVDYGAGTHTVKSLATVRVKVMINGEPKGDFAPMNVYVPPVTFTAQ